MPTSFQVRASLVEAPLLSASPNDRCGFRVDRVICLSAHVLPVLATGFVLPGSFRASVNSRLSIRGSKGNHTIFGCFRFALLRHPSCVGVSARSTSLPTRNLRLLFRLVRTGIRSPASNRRTAAIRHHPPTHKRTDERTEFSPWHSLIFRRGQEVGGFDCFPHPERGFRYGFRPLITSVACIPGIADSEHFWPRLRCSPLRLKTASAFGSIDCRLRSLQSSVTSLASCGFTTASTPCGHKLSLTATLSLSPTPPAAPTVSARFRSAVNPKPPLAIPSRRCRAAALHPPLTPAPYCQPRSSHPRRKKPPTFHAHGTFLTVIRLRRNARPRPRWSVRRCTDSTPADGQPLHSLRVCLRLGAKAGRQTLKPQADFRDCLSLHCITRHLPFASILM